MRALAIVPLGPSFLNSLNAHNSSGYPLEMLPQNYYVDRFALQIRCTVIWRKRLCSRHFLAVRSQVLIAAQRWLLSSTVCSSKFSDLSSAGASAGASTVCCMAACMELLEWTQLTQAQGSPAWWRDLRIDEMNGHETIELLVLCGAHWEGLDIDMLLLGHWPPNTVNLLLTSFSSSSLACSLTILQTPAASSACCMQLWRCIVLGCAGLKLACNICTPSHSPSLAKSSL